MTKLKQIGSLKFREKDKDQHHSDAAYINELWCICFTKLEGLKFFLEAGNLGGISCELISHCGSITSKTVSKLFY